MINPHHGYDSHYIWLVVWNIYFSIYWEGFKLPSRYSHHIPQVPMVMHIDLPPPLHPRTLILGEPVLQRRGEFRGGSGTRKWFITIVISHL